MKHTADKPAVRPPGLGVCMQGMLAQQGYHRRDDDEMFKVFTPFEDTKHPTGKGRRTRAGTRAGQVHGPDGLDRIDFGHEGLNGLDPTAD